MILVTVEVLGRSLQTPAPAVQFDDSFRLTGDVMVRRFYLRLFLVATGASVLGSCGGPTPPDPPVATTITLSPTSVTLDALGATQQLTVTVNDQDGNPMTGQTVTWTSAGASVASVSGTGLVTAVGNGSTSVTATSSSLSASATVNVSQAPASITVISGDAQSGTVGLPLAQALVVQVNDSRSNAIAGVSVSFVASGGGSVSSASGTTDAGGQASVNWTLGTASGTGQQVAVSVTGLGGTAAFSATATADVATDIAVVSGDAQTGTINNVLALPIVAGVSDQFANPVVDVVVAFAVTFGGGSFSVGLDTTDVNGEASSIWTLGPTIGAQAAEVSAAGLTGSPVAFAATGINFTFTAISPDTLVEGTTVTLTGSGYDDITPSNNSVSIDGVAATVTAATTTTIDATVPSFSCEPARDVDVTVSLGGNTSNPLTRRLHPAVFTGDVALGQQTIIQIPADFCLQFRPSATGGDEYLIGVGAAAESPGVTMAFDIAATAGGAATSSPFGAPVMLAVSQRPRAVRGGVFGELELARIHQMESEFRLRQWERENLDPTRNANIQVAPQRVLGPLAVPPAVGDLITIRVPDATGNACNFTEITTKVKVVGAAGVFVTDISNPATDSLTDAELTTSSNQFDTQIFDPDTLYFGAPSDLDDNQRVLIVLTIEVNKFVGGFAGFVFSGDLLDRASCASSDMGEIFYGHVPDPGDVGGQGPRSKAAVLGQMPSLIAHEFTHVIQTSRRSIVDPGVFMESWESEGQATFAEEVVGHAVLGNTTGANLDGAVVTQAGLGADWYQFIFTRLARYYGYDPTNPGVRLPDAPELCTLFGSLALNNSTACSPFWFYGASWSFMRYVSDRYEPSYVGIDKSGEVGLHRDWVSKNTGLSGVANFENLLNVQIDTLFARWAATLYTDDRVGVTADSVISMSSWKLGDVFNTLGANFDIVPADRTFSTFTDVSLAVRGGSTRYTRLSAAGARPALAIRVQAPGGGDLGPSMNPQIWVVRTK